MASVISDAGGRKRIQFNGPDGRRRTIRLGKVAKAQANTVKLHIEKLVAAKITGGVPEDDTSHWLATIGDDLHAKLTGHGLTTSRKVVVDPTLAAFADRFLAERTGDKPSTRTQLILARNDLVAYFGADKRLAEITEQDAERFRSFLRTRPAQPGRRKSSTSRPSRASYRDRNREKQPARLLAENTIRRRCGRARQVLRAAVKDRLIPKNPFAELEGGVSVRANEAREYFVTRDETTAVLAACPDAEWRLLFVLSRYGGLRCPSEHLALRWGDVDWERDRITVRAAKTEHHKGNGVRIVPMFPELRPYLEAVFDAAPDGTEYVFTRYRDSNANLRTQLQRIIDKAGVKPWPKLFQNLRASRATELAQDYPGYVAAEWLGHSQRVAIKHYWRATDEDYARATGRQAVRTTEATENKRAAQRARKAAQNPAHDTTKTVGMGVNSTEANREFSEEFNNRRTSIKHKMAEAGVEPARGLPPNGF